MLVEGIYEEYEGNYSATIAVLDVDNEDNVYFFNKEPIFVNENGNKCIWKQNISMWWIGNCEEIGQNKGFAYMNNCKCPWPK